MTVTLVDLLDALRGCRPGAVSYSAAEAGPLVGQTANWMLENARAEMIPHSRVGREIRFTDEHLKQILKACEVQPKAPLKPRVTARQKAAVQAAPGVTLIAKPPRPRKQGAA